MKQTSNFSDAEITEIMNYLLDSDYKIKNGLIRDTLAVEIFIGKYC